MAEEASETLRNNQQNTGDDNSEGGAPIQPNKKHIPTFLYNTWIQKYNPATAYPITKMYLYTKSNLNTLSSTDYHVLVNYNSYNNSFYFKNCDNHNSHFLNIDENEYDSDRGNHNCIQWSPTPVAQWTFIKKQNVPDINNAESFIICTMDGRYKLIIKNNKLFVRDDKNILHRNQKPAIIYVKHYIDNTNELTNNIITNDSEKKEDHVSREKFLQTQLTKVDKDIATHIEISNPSHQVIL